MENGHIPTEHTSKVISKTINPKGKESGILKMATALMEITSRLSSQFKEISSIRNLFGVKFDIDIS